MIKICEICNKDFYVRPSRDKRCKARFCSMKCFSHKIDKICLICDQAYKVQRFNKNSKYCSCKCLGIANSRREGYWMGKKRPTLKLPQHWKKGEKHPYWKGGISRLDKETRHSYEYIEWRKKIIERNKKCIWCGSRKNLQVDHIKSFKLFPEMRFDENNGRVLCFECHKKTPTYGFFPKKEGYYGQKVITI